MPSKLIIVSNRLPITVREEASGLRYQESIGGGMAAALAPLLNPDASTVWIGWDGSSRKLSDSEVASLQLPQRLIPVGFSEQAYESYYGNYANGSIWPVFHGMKPRRMYTGVDWHFGLDVIGQFADTIVARASTGDRVWIHDFHLVMLPKVLRERGISNRLGFFLHVPFPDEEGLRTLPHYREMLESMSMADVIGFQTAADADKYRHSIAGESGRAAPGNSQTIGVYPVGIDYERYAAGHTRKAVQFFHADIMKRQRKKRIIFSVSRLDYTKGIIEQLKAVEGFLAQTRTPEQFVYKLVVAPSRESLAEYRALRSRIETAVDAINARFAANGWQPVDYDNRPVGTDELIAWYMNTEIMLVTPLADGMNLVAKEYIAARPSSDGTLVLSRTAGAADQLTDAIFVDPLNEREMVAALQQAAAMPEGERRRRHLNMRRIVETEDALHWGLRFTEDLGRVR